MGLFSSIFGAIGSSKAAKAQTKSAELAISELQRQFDTARADLQPFVAPGQQALSQTQNASTVGGLDERLNQLRNSDAFGALREERLRGLQSQLGAVGLRRSGAALNEIADLDTSLLLGLENDLFARQSGLAANAQNAAAGQAAQAVQAGNSLASLQVGKGNAIAAGQVGVNNSIGQGLDALGVLGTSLI